MIQYGMACYWVHSLQGLKLRLLTVLTCCQAPTVCIAFPVGGVPLSKDKEDVSEVAADYKLPECG